MAYEVSERTTDLDAAHDRHPASDRDLVLAFQSGVVSAYDAIDQTCRPVAARICSRMLSNPDDADEAVQETMLRVLQALERFNGRYALRAWVARIATNVCLDAIRARSRRFANGAAFEARNGHERYAADPSEVVERADEAERVRMILSSLPARHRAALVLREFEGLSHEEIAWALETTPPRVKALIHRAKRLFRKSWGGRTVPAFLPLAWVPRWIWGHAKDGVPSGGAPAPPPIFVQGALDGSLAVVGERLAAVVAAVVVMGATVTLAPPAGGEPRPEAGTPTVHVAAAELGQRAETERDERPAEDRPAREASPSPTVTSSPEASPSPSPEASPAEADVREEAQGAAEPNGTDGSGGAPSPAPDPAPSPEPPAHPAGFGMIFTSDRVADERCRCDAAPRVADEQVAISDQGLREFSSRIEDGAILDATDQPAWAVEVEQRGTASTHQLSLKVWTSDGVSTYRGEAAATGRDRAEWGGWVYRFAGTYELSGTPRLDTSLPKRGRYTMELTFSWTEERLVRAVFSLFETGQR